MGAGIDEDDNTVDADEEEDVDDEGEDNTFWEVPAWPFCIGIFGEKAKIS